MFALGIDVVCLFNHVVMFSAMCAMAHHFVYPGWRPPPFFFAKHIQQNGNAVLEHYAFTFFFNECNISRKQISEPRLGFGQTSSQRILYVVLCVFCVFLVHMYGHAYYEKPSAGCENVCVCDFSFKKMLDFFEIRLPLSECCTFLNFACRGH